MRKRLAGLRAYPFLMAAYPVVAIIAANVEQVEIGVVFRPLLFSLVLCAVVYGLLALLLRRAEPAALLTTWWLLLFFSYGHVYGALRAVTVAGESLGRHRYVAIAWIVLAVVGAWWILRRASWGALPRVLAAVAAIAVALPVVQLVVFAAQSSLLSAGREAAVAASEVGILPEGQVLRAPTDRPLPDVYLIILDGYGRSDILEKVYDYDNTEFLQALRDLGFVVAECSQSNYAQTELSIASLTNLQYLHQLDDSFRPRTDNRAPLWALIRSSAVRRSLESLGYTTIGFETGFNWINLRDADLYLYPRVGRGLNDFELLFLRSTAGLVALDSVQVLPGLLLPELNHPNEIVRQRVRFVFQELERLGSLPGPKYVYAHIVAPHSPYVFDAAGEPVDPPPAGSKGEVVRQAFVSQSRYIGRRTIEMLEDLLSRSETPPIIVLQADHGPGEVSHAGRMGILNAYYFPGADEVIAPSITPVNSFRLVFNSVFGTSFTRLEDVSYYSTYSAPYDFTTIPPSCPP